MLTAKSRAGLCSTSGPAATLICRPKRGVGNRRPQLAVTHCSIKARWCIDIRYGVKMDAISMVQDWVRDVGSQAGLTAANAQILSGAVGIPESRLELEVEFDTLAELEAFWASIPPQDHKAWSQRVQNLIIDGSPRWEIYRTVPLPVAADVSASAYDAFPSTPASAAAPGRPRSAAVRISNAEPDAAAGGLIFNPTSGKFEEEGSSNGSQGQHEGQRADEQSAGGQAEGGRVVLDWKGDPMTINPGDKLPFF